MKKSLLVVFGALLSLSLASCGGEEVNKDPIVPPINDPVVPEVEVKEDFTIKTTCEAGKFKQESYLFSTVDKSSEYFELEGPKLEIEIDTSNWAYVTAYNQDFKLNSENQDVIPNDALTLKSKNNLSGSGGSNSIIGFDVNLDRSKIKSGTTKVKLFVKPSNGSSSADNLELCVSVEVKEFGTINQVVNDVEFKLNLSTLDPSLLTKDLSFVALDNNHIYGSNNIQRRSVKLTSFDELLTVKIPFNHEMSFFLDYYENGKIQFIQLNLESDDSYIISSGYYSFKNSPTSAINITVRN